jgi:hypothetical protein
LSSSAPAGAASAVFEIQGIVRVGVRKDELRFTVRPDSASWPYIVVVAVYRHGTRPAGAAAYRLYLDHWGDWRNPWAEPAAGGAPGAAGLDQSR